MNVRPLLLALFVALTIILASTTLYESGTRTTLTSISTSTSVSTTTATVTQTTIQTTTMTSTLDLYKAITDAYLSHIGAIESQNATALSSQYDPNATLLYSSLSPRQNGSVYGNANITGFYEGTPTNNSQAVSCAMWCFDLKAPFAFANETRSITISSDDKIASVTSQLDFYGTFKGDPCYVPGVGNCSGLYYRMGFDISYVLQGGRWLISTESLTYITLGVCTTSYSSIGGSVFHCEYGSG